MIARLCATLLAAAVMASSEAQAETTYDILRFQDLDGWDNDDHAAALSVFVNTCPDLPDPDWQSLCAVAQSQKPTAVAARAA